MKFLIAIACLCVGGTAIACGLASDPADLAAMASAESSCIASNQYAFGCSGVNANDIISYTPVYSESNGSVTVECFRQDCYDPGITFGGVCVSFGNNAFGSAVTATTIEKPICQSGSIIQTSNQVVGERIPMT